MRFRNSCLATNERAPSWLHPSVLTQTRHRVESAHGHLYPASHDYALESISTNSTHSSHEGTHRHTSSTEEDQWDFPSRGRLFAVILTVAPWWWKARPSDLYLTEYTAMIIFGPLLVILGIGFFCWLLFTLAVFALPFFVGLTIGIWAFHTGAGVLGGIAVGLVAGGVTFGLGQLALAVVPWAWARLLIILLYVAPATVAGYSATHGIAQMAMPSPTWQTIFAVIGAVAVTAFVRFTGMAAPGPAGQGLARG